MSCGAKFYVAFHSVYVMYGMNLIKIKTYVFVVVIVMFMLCECSH